jgi:hypothetical protein
MSADKVVLRWGVEQRLEFVEFRLFWEGHVNRGDLVDKFGISVNQASTDLNRYLGLSPDNMYYDKSAKTYVRGPEFKPRFLQPNAGRYLSQLHSLGEGILEPSETWIGRLPSFDAAPTPTRGVNARTLRTVVAAIRRNEMIEAKYQSLSTPEPRWRWITPHAIGFDGFRWHARAFCLDDEVFKDFLLSRILETRGTQLTDVTGEADAEWHDMVTIEIGPHPGLSESQQKVIALDYGMRGARSKIKVRKALLYYALRRLGLDTDPAARRPQDQQIILLNPEAVLGDRQTGHVLQELP